MDRDKHTYRPLYGSNERLIIRARKHNAFEILAPGLHVYMGNQVVDLGIRHNHFLKRIFSRKEQNYGARDAI